MNKKPELLSPAGSMESLKAAVNNGCDAVYLGGKEFNARQSAQNFTLKEIEEACDYCHVRGVRVYLTVNIVYKQKELQELLIFIEKVYAMGVDAFIVQDFGVASMLKEYFPNIKLHASTQMTANSLEDVQYLESMGFSKVVLSRELSLTEIIPIIKESSVEIESFIHGALCVCYSGQCIMSGILGGRSGNRGRCAQTCRLPYTLYKGADIMKEGYLLSPKDMQTVSILPELIESGIDSLKIEGRMKNPEYVAGVTRIYRKYIDLYLENPEEYKVANQDIKELTQLFNRGGFSEGYYHTMASEDMMSLERPKSWGLKLGFVDSYIPKYNRVTIRTREDIVAGDGIEIWTKDSPHVGTNISKASKAGEVISLSLEGNIQKNDPVYRTYGKVLTDELRKTWEKDTKKMEISGSFQAKKGTPMILQFWDNAGNQVYFTGDIVEGAENQPTTKEKVEQQLRKLGATSFALNELALDMDDDIFISISGLNQFRREAIEKLQDLILKNSKQKAIDTPIIQTAQNPFIQDKKVEVLVSDIMQLEAVTFVQGVHKIYFATHSEKELDEAILMCREKGILLYVALPTVNRQWRAKAEAEWLEMIKEKDFDGFLVRFVGQFYQVKPYGKKITLDYTMNIMNEKSVAHWKVEGADTICLSLEMNLQEINAVGDADCQMVVHGFLPMMKTQQCPVGNYVGEKDGNRYCKERNHQDMYLLKDRKGMKFPLLTDCENCVCTILNSQPLFTLKFYHEILDSPTGSVRLDFTKEGVKTVEGITQSYVEMTSSQPTISEKTRLLLERMQEKGSTKGHYFRGVE